MSIVALRAQSPDDLLAAAQAGQLWALDRLVALHRQGVYRYGLHVCRTTEDAEDAVQEALWAASRAIRTFRGTASSIASWLFTIVRRECLRLLERQRRSVTAPVEAGDEVAGEAIDPSDLVATRQQIDLLASAIAQLGHLDREVIVLRDIKELSAPEAAARLGISVAALKSRLHRARVNLRDQVVGLASGRKQPRLDTP
jgi:RNA polymerase sigma-70 factor, ECF subfamily